MQYKNMLILINKTVKNIQKNGYKHTIFKIINILIIKIFNIKLVSDYSSSFDKISRKIFINKKVVYSKSGYYMLDPMPSKSDLDLYYAEIYWNSREGKNYGVKLRDILHFYLLKKFILIDKYNNLDTKTFVNFGAGHLGISYNMWFEGFKVINIDPSHLPISFKKNWYNELNLNSIADNSIDIFYASHSIEHVNKIDELMLQIKRILKKNAYIFIEVPNANWEHGGVIKGRIDVPHTYYFTKIFFQDLFNETILNESFDENHLTGEIFDWEKSINEYGSVIRFIGKNI